MYYQQICNYYLYIMINYRLLIIAFFLSLLPVMLMAQSKTVPTAETINTIIKETSVSGELNQPIDELGSQFSQNPFGLPSQQNEKLMESYSEAFQPKSTLETIRHTFNENFNPDHAESVINWLKKDNTQKVHEAEKEFYTIQGTRKRIVSKYELEQDPPEQERLQLIQSLAQRTSAAETEIESRVIIFRAMINAFSELSAQQSFTERQVDSFAQNFRNQMKSQVDEQVTNHLLTKYHGIDDTTLEEYISFYDTEEGQWLSDTTSEAIYAALEIASDQLIKAVNEE